MGYGDDGLKRSLARFHHDDVVLNQQRPWQVHVGAVPQRPLQYDARGLRRVEVGIVERLPKNVLPNLTRYEETGLQVKCYPLISTKTERFRTCFNLLATWRTLIFISIARR